jgi:uncharacterized repeat protein (TIGR03806 family)
MRSRRELGSCGGLLLILSASLPGCGNRAAEERRFTFNPDSPPVLLSAFGLFQGNGASQTPAPGVIPYDVNTPLFSDYTLKYRFMWLPLGTSAHYDPVGPFEFPVGAILVKTFAYPRDVRDPSSGRRLIETRLLIHTDQGWRGLPYVWNEEQTEARLRIAGSEQPCRWIDADGQERENHYLVPNTNQCMACHENRKVMRPIGTTARNLNRSYDYGEGPENQLAHLTELRKLTGAPRPEQAPRLAVWNDLASGSLEERARAWLESNCAHCHNPDGPARTSGLDLTATQEDLFKRGFWKPPVAAGRGSGGRSFGIVPGRPDESILLYRIESRQPGVMMPEQGRRLTDREGTALVRAWIASLQQ